MMSDRAEAILADGLARLGRVRHGFFTRRGGVSGGLYGTLNCGFGSGDDRASVAENRARAARRLGAPAPTVNTVHQVHGREVAVVNAGWPPESAPRADAMVSATPGVAFGVLAADCTPVLFADPVAGVAGAAHAGWKGALDGVVEATVAAMVRLGARPERIEAAVGPTIAQASYQVGAELRQAFVDADPGHARWFAADAEPGRFRFDLPGFVAGRLRAAGVGRIEDVGRDTYGEPDLFFSYRRATHRGEADYGRALAAIMLVP